MLVNIPLYLVHNLVLRIINLYSTFLFHIFILMAKSTSSSEFEWSYTRSFDDYTHKIISFNYCCICTFIQLSNVDSNMNFEMTFISAGIMDRYKSIPLSQSSFTIPPEVMLAM
jgi:hypothetical protein